MMYIGADTLRRLREGSAEELQDKLTEGLDCDIVATHQDHVIVICDSGLVRLSMDNGQVRQEPLEGALQFEAAFQLRRSKLKEAARAMMLGQDLDEDLVHTCAHKVEHDDGE